MLLHDSVAILAQALLAQNLRQPSSFSGAAAVREMSLTPSSSGLSLASERDDGDLQSYAEHGQEGHGEEERESEPLAADWLAEEAAPAEGPYGALEVLHIFKKLLHFHNLFIWK